MTQPLPPLPEAWQQADEITISTLETLKIFSDPLRQQMIMALTESPRTVKQIAAELDRAPTKLYYHVKLLEDHGLIRVTDTRVVSGIIEKRYQAAARHFAIDRHLFAPPIMPTSADEPAAPDETVILDDTSADEPPLLLAIDSVLDPLREEIRHAAERGLINLDEDAPPTQKLRLARGNARLQPDDAARFFARLEALLAEFEAVDGEEDLIGYRLIIGLYPAQAPRTDDEQADGAG